MGHSDISVTMNVYTHRGFDDAGEKGRIPKGSGGDRKEE